MPGSEGGGRKTGRIALLPVAQSAGNMIVMSDRATQALGLIAGAGEFPFLVARGARRAGQRVVIVGLRGCFDEALRQEADVFYEAGLARLGRWIRLLRRNGVSRAIMAGRVVKADVVALPRWRQWLAYMPDWASIKVWFFRAADRRNDTLLRAVADEMAARGVELIDSTAYCPDAMAAEGTPTRMQLPTALAADAELGWTLAREMGRLDVGQSVAIKDKDVIAVEAIEGTDAMIARAGALCKAGGWVLVKVAKPNQDMRFDVPTIGPQTVENVAKAGGKAIIIEAGKTLFLDREKTIALADQKGIAIVCRGASDT
jgi:DUF1009 family protein